MRLVIMDGHAVNPGDLSWDVFRAYGEVTVCKRTAPEDVIPRAKDADCVFTNKVVFDEGVLDRLPKLRYIGVLATGTNVIDLAAAEKRGIVVTNIPAYSTDSVAQLVFAHILNVVNRPDRYADDTRRGRWSGNPDFCYWDSQFHELAALTLGIVGLGNIGRKVADIAHAFGMRINASTSKQPSQLPDYINKVSLEDLYSSSDIITLHCPLTPDTREMINAGTISTMRRGAILVNTGRGPLVDEAAAAEALSTGQLAAYCADVMCKEPPELANPLFLCHNAFITPHLAWGTIEARRRLMGIAEENLRSFLAGTPVNTVK
ncbi:MAG: D-2-hydroxyacid dehydrogenase [Prevotella sp.]|nr:D-2-hydroxyacid dehydrogenase [Prevotella sp.]